MSSSVIVGLRLDLSRTDLSNSESYILKLNSALCWCAGGINSESVCMNPFFTNRAGSSIVMELSKVPFNSDSSFISKIFKSIRPGEFRWLTACPYPHESSVIGSILSVVYEVLAE